MSRTADQLGLPAPAVLTAQLRLGLPDFGDISWVETTGSTNADLLQRARQGTGPAKPWLRGARRQSQGRGRAGRVWQNEADATLMFSCAFDTYLPLAQLPALSPLTGLAACEVLQRMVGSAGERLRVKWPNDLVWDEAKLAGILVETIHGVADPEGRHAVVIGIGVNLHNAAWLAQELERAVADWDQVCGAAGRAVAPRDIVAAVALAWQAALAQCETGGFAGFAERYAKVDALAGRAVNVLHDGKVLRSGVAAGVDPHGRLLVDATDGRAPVAVGEISVRATQ
jgi:BirA family biotin operon repressor/biotin-[acetyl-CoA-carboxylase] ligase